MQRRGEDDIMLVGPMKRKVVLTAVISCLIPIVVLGVLGFILVKNYRGEIEDLKKQSEVVNRYVLKEDRVANSVITADDVELAGVKSVSAPLDSYEEKADPAKKVKGLKDLVGRRLKINARKNTILSEAMFYEEDKEPTIDLRLQEFNMITLPSDLVENDYIDVRVRFPSGEDYSVLIGKKVEAYSNNTIFIRLTEDEILTVGSAIIEAYILDGTKLYANKYVDPANQLFEYREVDYVAKYNSAVSSLIANLTETRFNEARDAYLQTNPEATEDELTTLKDGIKVTRADLSFDDIVRLVDLSKDEVEDIEKAVNEKNETVLNMYKHKIVVSDKQIARTYPVKENVLNIIKANPNILEEVKANFDTEAILARRINMADTTITEENGNAEKIKAALTEEIQTQKDERVAYLKALMNNTQKTSEKAN